MINTVLLILTSTQLVLSTAMRLPVVATTLAQALVPLVRAIRTLRTEVRKTRCPHDYGGDPHR